VSVPRHVDRLLGVIPDAARRDLAESPEIGIQIHFPLTIEAATSFASRGNGGWCDGSSITDAGIILYRPTNSRRENFTLLHELAHHLIASDDACLNWLANRPEPLRELEQLCDQLAGALLIPKDLVDTALAGRPPSATTLDALYDLSQGSRSACAVALAQRLPCDWFIAIIDTTTRTVFFSARARETRPYGWKGDPVPTGHPLRVSPVPERAVTWWPYPDGEHRQFYLSTLSKQGFVCAMFAEDDLWDVASLHFSDIGRPDRGYHGTIKCPSCGYSGNTRWWPHHVCGEGTCPRCGECGCDRRARQERHGRCRICTVSVLEHLLVDDVCPGCR
jgi:hypothetical protein